MYQWIFLALFFRDALVKLHKSHDKEHFHHFGKASSGFICHLFCVSDLGCSVERIIRLAD